MAAPSKKYPFTLAALALLALATASYGIHLTAAFSGPTGTGGQGTGALSVDAYNNVAIGTTTSATTGAAKLFITGSSTNSSYYALYATDQTGNPVLVVRNDGKVGVATSTFGTATFRVYGKIESASGTTAGGFVFPDGTLQTTAGGSSVGAANISIGAFGSIAGVGNYSFPANLSVGTSTTSGAATLFAFGAGASLSGATSQLDVFSSAGAAAGVGGAITLAGYYATSTAGSAPSSTRFAAIQGIKENATSNDSAGALIFYTHANGSNLSEKARISSAGNFGIGTTTPATLLHVYGAVANPIELQRTTAAVTTIQYTNTAGSYYTGLDASGNFDISTSSSLTGPQFSIAAGTGVITVTNRITGVSTPTASSDAATKGYVDGVNVGVRWAGYTTTTYTGLIGGGAGGNKLGSVLCNSNYAGSHWGQQTELIALGSNYPWSQTVWTADGSGCTNWTSNSISITGNVANTSQFTTDTCNVGHYLACVY